ncbi:response regulator transcription factor [Nocardioides sp.]|uniref:response regulator transcription factor n=1 Tax=Nocardioides sp. TaxID=35761 RepID=UPI002737403B|nr:response regulator transcription factor [Nocardioides sp.]MDP3894832.1 response regulator transcription factor [Nocardioides sp.]
MSPAPIRLALMNDYEVVVKGLFHMLAPYSHRIEIVELGAGTEPITDVDLVLYDGFGREQIDDSIQRVIDQMPGGVVVYSWSLQPELIRVGLDRGIAGYLSKALTSDELVDALERIHAGELVLMLDPGPESDETPGAWPGQELGLTAREAEILALITQGLTNRDIAERAYIGDNTVKTHIRNVYRKIGVTRRAEAVRWGMHHGFEPDRVRILTESAPA